MRDVTQYLNGLICDNEASFDRPRYILLTELMSTTDALARVPAEATSPTECHNVSNDSGLRR
jgi:hypothetical protein